MKRLPHHLFLSAALGSMAFGCQSAGRPQSMTEAKTGLDNERASELALLRPALVKDAKVALGEGDRAFDRGNRDEAELHGFVALARLKTAEHLVAADAAQAKATAMKRASVTAHSDRLERERFAALGKRVDALTADVRRTDGSDPAQQQASLAIAQARRAQGNAIAIGQSGSTQYRQGRIRLEQAVQSLDLGLFAESRGEADEATMLFVAVGADRNRSQGRGDKTPPSLTAGDKRLAETLTSARSARSRARSMGADPVLLEAGSYHLALAQEARTNGDSGDALREAQMSLKSFEEAAAKTTISQTTSGAEAFSSRSSSSSSSSSSSPSSPSSNAQWAALGLARADAIGAGLPAQCGPAFDEFEAVYTLAKEQRASGSAEASSLMVRAEERLRRCQGMVKTGATVKPAANSAVAAAKPVDDRLGLSAVARAQLAISAARMKNVTPARIEEAKDLVRQAEDWLARGAPLEAKTLADGVAPLLADVAPTTAATTATAATTTDSRVCRSARSLLEQNRAQKGDSAFSELEDLIGQLKCAEVVTRLMTTGEVMPATTATTATTGATTAPVEERVWRPAYQAILDARVARTRMNGIATNADRRALARAEGFINQARDAWTRGDYLAAERYARAATADYQAINDAVLARRREAEKQGNRDRESAAQTAADRAASASAKAAADRAEAARIAAEDAAADKARAEADKAAAEKADAEKADANADRDKAATDADLQKAEADKAAADKAAADKAAADKAAADKAAADKAAQLSDKRAADQAAQDAAQIAMRRLDVSLTMCSKESCEKRDLEKLTTAKKMKSEAATAFAERRFSKATDLANDGAKLVEEARGAPVDDTPIQAEVKVQRVQEAISRCEKEACAKRSPKRFAELKAKASELNVLMGGGKFVDVVRIADEVLQGLTEVLAIELPFEIPESITTVTKQNNRLVLNPRVNFRTSGVEILATSLGSVADLASVIQHNVGHIMKVSLTGHTDNAGDAGRNLQLSKDRAAALKAALVERGVDGSIISTDGRGEDEPIADNATAAGRDANRRVDIIITEH